MQNYFNSDFFSPVRMVYKAPPELKKSSQEAPKKELPKQPKITDGHTIEITKVGLDKVDASVSESLFKEVEKCMVDHKDNLLSCLTSIDLNTPWQERNIKVATALGFDVVNKSMAYVKKVIQGVQAQAFKALDLQDPRAKCDGKCGDYTTAALELLYDIKSNIDPKTLKDSGELEAVRFMRDEKLNETAKSARVFDTYKKLLSVGLNAHLFEQIKEPLLATIDMSRIDDSKYLLGVLYKIKHDGLDQERFFDMALTGDEKKRAQAYAELFLLQAESVSEVPVS